MKKDQAATSSPRLGCKSNSALGKLHHRGQGGARADSECQQLRAKQPGGAARESLRGEKSQSESCSLPHRRRWHCSLWHSSRAQQTQARAARQRTQTAASTDSHDQPPTIRLPGSTRSSTPGLSTETKKQTGRFVGLFFAAPRSRRYKNCCSRSQRSEWMNWIKCIYSVMALQNWKSLLSLDDP